MEASESPQNMNQVKSKPYEGGCHCGAVRFEVMIRTTASKVMRAISCNCSICTKKGFVHYIVPEEDFTLLQGKDELTEYRFNTGTAKHLFCRICGIHSFYRPRSHPDCWNVNLNCLDQATEPNFITQFEIQAFDGQNWEDNIHSITQGSRVDNTD